MSVKVVNVGLACSLELWWLPLNGIVQRYGRPKVTVYNGIGNFQKGSLPETNFMDKCLVWVVKTFKMKGVNQKSTTYSSWNAAPNIFLLLSGNFLLSWAHSCCLENIFNFYMGLQNG